MLPDLSVIRGRYLQDILEQPPRLQDSLESLREFSALKRLVARLKEGEFHRIVLTGMGSSFHALHPCTLQFVDQGLTALMVETSELVHYKARFFDKHTLMVVVSQSGQSAEVIRLLEVNRDRSTLIAVTNTSESPLAENAEAAIITAAGEEFSVSCKTYVTALQALQWLSDLMCGCDLKQTRRRLQDAATAAASYLAHWEFYVSSLAEMLQGVRNLFLVGRGGSLAAVGTGALIIKEADHVQAEGMSSAAFRHGPLEMLQEDIFVLVFAGDKRTLQFNSRLIDDIREQGGRAQLVGDNSDVPAFRLGAAHNNVRPILEILPVQ
ncbi:MAG TPA: SIS domain-containing protein, partial [Terriglobales bacterium]|nr:SIS domain-containing protein [Terriglobales bacterium]